MRLTCLLCVLLFACGDDKAGRPDAGPRPDSGSRDGGPTGPLTLDCASYCAGIAARCQASNQQYGSTANCMDSCMNFPAGALGDATGNTLGCRVYHTELAQTDPLTHCAHAGPAGGGACGTICEGFCAIAPVECPGEWTANTCINQCGGIPSTDPYNTAAMGNTIQCRLYHLTMAASDPTNHCPHTVRNNNPVCM